MVRRSLFSTCHAEEETKITTSKIVRGDYDPNLPVPKVHTKILGRLRKIHGSKQASGGSNSDSAHRENDYMI